MQRVYNVGAMARDQASQLSERPRLIQEMDTQADQTPILHQAAFNNPAQKRHVDVAAAHQHRCLCTLWNQSRSALQQRGESCCARTFSQCLLAFKQHQNR